MSRWNKVEIIYISFQCNEIYQFRISNCKFTSWYHRPGPVCNHFTRVQINLIGKIHRKQEFVGHSGFVWSCNWMAAPWIQIPNLLHCLDWPVGSGNSFELIFLSGTWGLSTLWRNVPVPKTDNARRSADIDILHPWNIRQDIIQRISVP